MAKAKIRPWNDVDAFTRAVVVARVGHATTKAAYAALVRRPQWKHVTRAMFDRQLSYVETRHWVRQLSGGYQDLAGGVDGQLSEVARDQLLRLMRRGEDERVRVSAALGVLVHERWKAEQKRKEKEIARLNERASKIEAALESIAKEE